MAWIGVVTNAGRALLDSYALGGHTLTLTGATVGSGTVSEANLRVQTALTSEKDTASIISAEAITGGSKYKIQVGPASAQVGAYTAHQIGLWAKLDNGSATLLMLMQDSVTGVSVPLASVSPNFAFGMYATLAVDNTDNLTVNIDESAYVSQATLAAALALKVDVGAIADEAVNTITEQSDSYPALTAGDKLSVIVGKIKKWLSSLKSKLDGIESGAQVNSITGVKGNSESTYRTGNVNLTAANVGALSVAQAKVISTYAITDGSKWTVNSSICYKIGALCVLHIIATATQSYSNTSSDKMGTVASGGVPTNTIGSISTTLKRGNSTYNYAGYVTINTDGDIWQTISSSGQIGDVIDALFVYPAAEL